MTPTELRHAREARAVLDDIGVYPTLRAVRESLAYTLAELASVLGVAYSTLSGYELGYRPVPDEVRERLFEFCGSWIGPGKQPVPDHEPGREPADVARMRLGTLTLGASLKAQGRPVDWETCIAAAVRFDKYGWPWDQRREIA